MSNPVCISPLKFYDSLAKQSHRKSYAYGHISPLITKTGWIPSFQFVIPNQDYINGANGVYNIVSKTVPAIFMSNPTQVVDIKAGKQAKFRFTGPGELASTNYIQFGLNDANGQTLFHREVYASDNWESDFITLSRDAVLAWLIFYGSDWSGETVKWDILYNNNVLDCIQECSLYEVKSNTVVKNLLSYAHSSAFDILTIDDYKVLIHKGNVKIENLSEGLYYLKIASGNGGIWTYYSEIFCFDNVTKDCLELEYWNETGNFAVKNGIIAFPADFHFKLLLKGEIGKPEYNFEEESTKRLGYIFVESQVSKKTYKFNVIVPEYICDALRLVRLCDNKIIRCKDDEYEAITFEMEAEWQTQGDLASVTCEFETDNVVANIGGFVPDKLGGDYNNDYNEDFDKE